MVSVVDAEAAVDACLCAAVATPRRLEGLETIGKLLRNVQSKPSEAKYRQVNKSNPAIQKRLFPECFGILCAAGFQDEGEMLNYRSDPGPQLQEVLDLVDSLLLSLGAPTSEAAAPAASAAPAVAASSGYAAASSSKGPAESKRALQEQRIEKAKQETKQSQNRAQDELAALRQLRAGQYQQQGDAALALHLSRDDGGRPYDPIAGLNQARGATHSLVTCTRCGTSLRYNSATHAKAVLCPCGALLQPVHMQGQRFAPQNPSDLPVEPGEPLDQESRPRATHGPFITVRGPDGEPTRLPLHSVLSMVRQHESRKAAGAQDETIEALPTRTYEGGGSASGNVEESRCQICMEDFAEGDELRTLPCFHLFHAQCVDQWLKVNSICPICRHKI